MTKQILIRYRRDLAKTSHQMCQHTEINRVENTWVDSFKWVKITRITEYHLCAALFKQKNQTFMLVDCTTASAWTRTHGKVFIPFTFKFRFPMHTKLILILFPPYTVFIKAEWDNLWGKKSVQHIICIKYLFLKLVKIY